MTNVSALASPLLLQAASSASAHHAATGGAGQLGRTLGAYLLGAGIVVLAVLGAAWSGRRLRADLRRRTADLEDAAAKAALGPSEVTARHVFRTLQEKRIATASELAAMSPRERQLLFETVATRVTPLAGVPAVQSGEAGGSGGGAAHAAAARRAVPTPKSAAVPIGSLHCPACGAAVSIDTDAARAVGPCAGCGRRIAARREGTRLSVTVDDR